MDPFFILLHIGTVAFGLIIGSFLTVCIFRLPLGREKGPPDLRDARELGDIDSDTEVEESLAGGVETEEPESELHEVFTQEGVSVSFPKRSFCRSCGVQLYWYNNIPFFSWLFQGGKCTACKSPISMMYPTVELASGLFALLALYTFVLQPPFSIATALVVYLFTCALLVITFIDIEYYIIPNKITYPGVLLGVGLAGVNQFTGILADPFVPDLMQSFWGFMAGAGFLWFVGKTYEVLKKRQGLGFGDVKLLALIGVFFGPHCALFTIFVGSVVGAVLGVLILLFFRHTLSRPLPFGPYLAIATALFLYGEAYGIRSWFPLPFTL